MEDSEPRQWGLLIGVGLFMPWRSCHYSRVSARHRVANRPLQLFRRHFLRHQRLEFYGGMRSIGSRYSAILLSRGRICSIVLARTRPIGHGFWLTHGHGGQRLFRSRSGEAMMTSPPNVCGTRRPRGESPALAPEKSAGSTGSTSAASSSAVRPRTAANEQFPSTTSSLPLTFREEAGLILTRESVAFFDPVTAKLTRLSDPSRTIPGTASMTPSGDPQGRLWRARCPSTMGSRAAACIDWTRGSPRADARRSRVLEWHRVECRTAGRCINRELFAMRSFAYDSMA